jgi:cold shock CspA family protein
MSRGKIQRWAPDQGEGKIRDDKGGPPLDFTVEDLLNPDAVDDLQQGDIVSFQIEEPRHAVMVDKA